MSLKNPIKLFRALSKMSQGMLASQIGVSRQTLIRWEQGSTPNDQHILKIAEIMNINPIDLEVKLMEAMDHNV